MKKLLILSALMLVFGSAWGQGEVFVDIPEKTTAKLNRIYYQSFMTSNTNWTRGIIGNNIYWDDGQWGIDSRKSSYSKI